MSQSKIDEAIRKALDTVLKPLSLVVRWKSTVENFQRASAFVPPGHFYSPIPNLDEIVQRENQIWNDSIMPGDSNDGINWEQSQQLSYLDSFCRFYEELPFPDNKEPNLRFYYQNPSYSYSDAIFLYCFIRYLKPKRIIEIGSGHSTCLMLDTNDIFFDGIIDITCIEPYPELLKSLISDEDIAKIQILDKCLQDIDLSEFEALSCGDILFVDSSHVAKTGSDVNWLFFHVLPRLPAGVCLHMHDIWYNFEYPKDWIYEGRAWNEMYLLRAFLSYNSTWKIAFCNTYLQKCYRALFAEKMPLCLRNPGGSIWLIRSHDAE